MKKLLPIATLFLISGLVIAQTGTSTLPSSQESSMNSEIEKMESTTTKKKKDQMNTQTPTEQQRMEDSSLVPSSGTTTQPSSETDGQMKTPTDSSTSP